MKTAQPEKIKLAPPGAGVPFIVRLFLTYFTNPFRAGREDRSVMRDRFKRNHEKILHCYRSIRPENRETKILVPKMPGLEDSSRYWSAKMVLEHVVIVDQEIAQVIVELSHGRTPKKVADTAAVKPQGEKSLDQVEAEFESITQNLMDQIEQKEKNLDSGSTWPHPWFGPFTARKWYWLLGIHAGIHLRQIRKIQTLLAQNH